ncbi:sulfite exporter TauE/SafE family protein [Neomegalonema sp.]|uniref:sulfite exporter TauE/SafE family protein n=1 Tax=Neomegalonema sp. TaxID=2039713 RepID=UPI00260E1769|nr:sulfite exporter TauE/SafE family protein [Neomegalonema sp.]MDD2867346.1 methylamine utilization protein MauF [Neomegalonema sp.]
MTVSDRISIFEIASAPDAPAHAVADCAVFPEAAPRGRRLLMLLGAAGVGILAAGAAHLAGGAPQGTRAALGAGILAGGLLSTWSPCGYSSLSLLRPVGRPTARARLAFLPTLAMHALGYALGAGILGGGLGLAGGLLGFSGAGFWSVLALALAALLYGAHQFDFLRVPYPQRRAQVPHDARNRFSMETVGLLYGFSLGLNYLTYVQTPILYLVTALAFVSGDPATGMLIFAIFNLGRFLPMLANLTAASDMRIQMWLARRQESAAMLDGAILVSGGAAALCGLLAFA